MTIFNVDEIVTPAAEAMGKGFMKEANQNFDSQLSGVYDAIQRFWFRNQDADGNPIAEASKTDPQPTGPEILEALGTNAAAIMSVAYARVVMLVTIATELGLPNVIDQTRLALPYAVTYNPDGSLKSAKLEQWYIDMIEARNNE